MLSLVVQSLLKQALVSIIFVLQDCRLNLKKCNITLSKELCTTLWQNDVQLWISHIGFFIRPKGKWHIFGCACFKRKCILVLVMRTYKSKCPSVRLSVRLSVCLFTLEVPFKRLFAPTFRSRMSNIFKDSESLGKSNGKKWSQIGTFLFETCLKSPRKKKFFFFCWFCLIKHGGNHASRCIRDLWSKGVSLILAYL